MENGPRSAPTRPRRISYASSTQRPTTNSALSMQQSPLVAMGGLLHSQNKFTTVQGWL